MIIHLHASSPWALASSSVLELVVATHLRETWACGLISLCSYSVTLGNSLSIFEPWFSHLLEVLFVL